MKSSFHLNKESISGTKPALRYELLIASLAVADSLVGLVVMPFSATYEGMDQAWVFGSVWCELWHSLDVLASTASILHLCVISLDRYWAITDPFNYPVKMNDKRAGYLIVLVWVCSSSISFPAIAWWRVTAEGLDILITN